MEKIADLHCHPSLKPTYNSVLPNMWVKKRNITTGALFRHAGLSDKLRKIAIDMFLRTMAKYTQSNLEACFKGRNKLVFFAIYPPERPFMKPSRPFRRGTDTQRAILKAIFNNKSIDVKIIRALTGFSRECALEFLEDIYDNPQVDYFQDLLDEYHRILSENGKTYQVAGYGQPAKLKLINNFNELENLTNYEVGGIITVEGAHSLAKYNKDDLFESRNINDLDNASQTALKQSFIDNVKRIKDLDYPPFFITFSHHFNNLISGHSKSFKDPKNKIMPGFSSVFDQRKGLNDGFTDFGKTLITDHLLAKKNGKRRILIDTKHMSLKCRDEFYQIVRNHPDNIPIVCSHTAINGISNRAEAARRKDTNKLDHRSYVSRWDINITDEDITDIFDTDGIIGICMHDGRMPGGKFSKLVKEQNSQGNSVRVQRLHTQMFLTNVFHVVRINLAHIRKLNQAGANIDEKEAWKTVCLGTDFDGIIDPFDHFNTSEKLVRFKARCKDAIRFNFSPLDERKRARVRHVGEYNSKPMGKREFEELQMGYNPEQIVDMVFYDNLSEFCRKYFNDGYLT